MSNAFWFGFYAGLGAMLAGLAGTVAITILAFLATAVWAACKASLRGLALAWEKLTINETEEDEE